MSTSSTIYCAIWNETIVGRSGNDLASAFVNIILQHIIDHNLDVQNVVTWSDSCVPQNRNKIISTAIIGFMLRNSRVKSVTMKYSVPGYSRIQEVDNARSQIEKHTKKIDIWSPLSFVRSLLRVNTKKPCIVLQMSLHKFKDFHKVSK